MKNEEKELEIIEGDGTNINMSPVSNHIISIEHKNKTSKKLIVPKAKKIVDKKDNKQ